MKADKKELLQMALIILWSTSSSSFSIRQGDFVKGGLHVLGLESLYVCMLQRCVCIIYVGWTTEKDPSI